MLVAQITIYSNCIFIIILSIIIIIIVKFNCDYGILFGLFKNNLK